MMSRTLIAGLFISLASSVQAANISADGTGQVLLFPYMAIGESQQTLLEVHNNDTTQGTALRVAFKDGLNGRPLAQLNVYLGPGDSWTTSAYQPEGSLPRLLNTGDSSCTVALTDVFDNDFQVPNDNLTSDESRLYRGWIEVYQMGMVPASLASDCGTLKARNEVGGSWYSNSTSSGSAEDMTQPNGSLTGWSSVIYNEFGHAYQVPPLVIESFTAQTLHFSPNVQNRPNLSQVNPATSVRMVKTAPGSDAMVQQISTWNQSPILAIDALLMSNSLEGNYSVDIDILATSLLLFYNPTRPYHADVQQFYQSDSAARRLAPFNVSTPPQPGENMDNTELLSIAFNRDGDMEEPSFHSQTCTDSRWGLNEIYILNFVGIYGPCSQGEGAVLVRNKDGHLKFDLAGQTITSDEGHVYTGLPATGYLLEAIRFEKTLSDGTEKETVYSWTRTLNTEAPVVSQ